MVCERSVCRSFPCSTGSLRSQILVDAKPFRGAAQNNSVTVPVEVVSWTLLASARLRCSPRSSMPVHVPRSALQSQPPRSTQFVIEVPVEVVSSTHSRVLADKVASCNEAQLCGQSVSTASNPGSDDGFADESICSSEEDMCSSSSPGAFSFLIDEDLAYSSDGDETNSPCSISAALADVSSIIIDQSSECSSPDVIDIDLLKEDTPELDDVAVGSFTSLDPLIATMANLEFCRGSNSDMESASIEDSESPLGTAILVGDVKFAMPFTGDAEDLSDARRERLARI